MSFTAYMLDVVSDTIYPARITIEDGLFKESLPGCTGATPASPT